MQPHIAEILLFVAKFALFDLPIRIQVDLSKGERVHFN